MRSDVSDPGSTVSKQDAGEDLSLTNHVVYAPGGKPLLCSTTGAAAIWLPPCPHQDYAILRHPQSGKELLTSPSLGLSRYELQQHMNCQLFQSALNKKLSRFRSETEVEDLQIEGGYQEGEPTKKRLFEDSSCLL